MKKTPTLIVANWKENLTAPQAKRWLEEFSMINNQLSNGVEVVVCPSFVLIPFLHSQLSPLTSRLSLGAQDVSKFEEGQYTGEVSAKMLKDFVKYVIVGHSERRKYFNETDEDAVQKIKQCLKYGLTPIVCVSNLEQVSKCHSVNESRIIFAHEPLEAISTRGQFRPDDPEHANLMAEKIKTIVGKNTQVLYGGSVTAENVKPFIEQPDINGVLVGEASLDPEEFSKIVFNST